MPNSAVCGRKHDISVRSGVVNILYPVTAGLAALKSSCHFLASLVRVVGCRLWHVGHASCKYKAELGLH